MYKTSIEITKHMANTPIAHRQKRLSKQFPQTKKIKEWPRVIKSTRIMKWRKDRKKTIVENIYRPIGSTEYKYGLPYIRESNMLVSENGTHTDRTSIRVRQINIKNNKEVARFYSYASAGRATGIAQQSIGAVCNGKGKTAGGYKWETIKPKNYFELVLKADKYLIDNELEEEYDIESDSYETDTEEPIVLKKKEKNNLA